MPKKTKKENVQKIEQQNVIEEKAKVQPTEQEKQPDAQPKEKSIIKPLFFFAVFVACLGAAALYPYMTEEYEFRPIKPTVPEPELFIDDEDLNALKDAQNTPAPVVIEVIEKNESAVPEQAATPETCAAKDKMILSQKRIIDELNEKIHRLELMNLNLNEKIASTGNLTPLTARLMEEMYTGKAFGATLNALLMQDPQNAFALMVQENLSAYANNGLATPERLKEMFYANMQMAKNAFYTRDENASWNQKWGAYFKSLVYVYPKQMDLNKTQGVNLLFLARQQVDAGHFEQALQTIDKLPDFSKRFMAGFSQNTQHYLTAMQMIKAFFK